MRCRTAALLMFAIASGCEAGSERAAPSDAPYQVPTITAAALPARTWRLSHAQYAQAVQSFLGVTPDTSAFEAELDNGLFPNMSGSGLVRAPLAADYYDSADAISDGLDAVQLSALIDGRPLTAAEKPAFLGSAIRRAFRRPATAEDLAAYGELFDESDASEDAASPFREVVRALLTSPYFLYRTELGSDPTLAISHLTDYEVASLLSFSLLGQPPSAAVMVAADRGELSDPSRQLAALLDTPQAAAQLQVFLTQWLELQNFEHFDKDPVLFPGYPSVRPELRDEASTFLAKQGGMTGTLDALFTTPLAPPASLAAFYGSDPSAAGAIGARTGVLDLGAVIAVHSRTNITSPTLRGLFVRDRVLCQQVHLPPGGAPNIVDTLLGASAPRTTREMYERHAQNSACAGCHVLLDSIGFNFEDIDAAGRFRTRDNGVPVDTSGELRDSDVSGPTADRAELSRRLAGSEWVRECVARQAFRFYLGAVEPDRGAPAVQAARAALEHGTFRELLVALMTSPTALERVKR